MRTYFEAMVKSVFSFSGYLFVNHYKCLEGVCIAKASPCLAGPLARDFSCLHKAKVILPSTRCSLRFALPFVGFNSFPQS